MRVVGITISQGSLYKPVNLVESVKTVILEPYIMLDTFREVTTIKELTNEEFLRRLNEQDDKEVDLLDVDALLSLVNKKCSH